MGEKADEKLGRIGWLDLTVEDATSVRDFYQQVVGWSVESLDMGGYSDYVMSAGETAVAGVCHARGPNAALPTAWLVYITVADLDGSIMKCQELGGSVILPTRNYGEQGRYAVIRDPAGAVLALYQESKN